MIDLNKKLAIEQLDNKFKKLAVLNDIVFPGGGWIKSIRTALNMSLVQLAKRLNITSVSVREMELREFEKGITLKKLSEAAEALDCRFVYGFIPHRGSLDKTIEKRSLEIAEEIIMRTSHSMKLEDQENSEERIQKAIKDRADKIKNEMPKYLWD